MKSTKLADLFYRLDVNPFFVVVLGVLIVPVVIYVILSVLFDWSIWYSFLSTIAIFCLCSLIFIVYFHRNPKRSIPLDDHSILSPADGQVVYIKTVKKGKIIESTKKKNTMKLTELVDINNEMMKDATGVIIGIELRLFDVHITRSPVTGEKLLDHHVSGKIVPMTNPLFEFINDRETVVINKSMSEDNKSDRSLFAVAIVQIATFITRTVKSFVKEKTMITQGEPLGSIRLGSQVDLVLFSSNVNLLVSVGDRVYAGISKIAEIKNV